MARPAASLPLPASSSILLLILSPALMSAVLPACGTATHPAQAASFATSGIFVVTVFAMWSKVGHRASAYAALIAGTAVYAGGEHLEMLPHPYLASVLAALVVYVAVAPLRPADTAVSG